MEIERDLTSEIIAAYDVDAPAIEIKGKLHRRVLRAAQTYVTAAGPMVAERWLYRERDDDSQPAVSPVERRLGTIDFWTPKAAKQALWVVAQMTPQKAAETFARIGSMTPSKSSLDRLPKKLSEVWEANREEHEAALRDAIVVPEGAVSVAVSLDGVLAPIDGGDRRPRCAPRQRAKAASARARPDTESWAEWERRAVRSRIPPLVAFAKRLAVHAHGIVAHARWPLHAGLLEGINNKIKVIERMAYGLRGDVYFFLKIRSAFPGNPG